MIQMKPPYALSEIMRKEPFRTLRPAPEGYSDPFNPLSAYAEYNSWSQSDFLRQYFVSGHKINDPMYYRDKTKVLDRRMADGTISKQTYIQHMTRIAMPWQQMIVTKHLTALTGNNISFQLSAEKTTQEQERLFYRFLEGWKEKDMEAAWYESAHDALITGDVAFCGYIYNGIFGWRVFSFFKGDTLWPHYNSVGHLDAFARTYEVTDSDGKVRLHTDVWDDRYVHHYVQVLHSEEPTSDDEGAQSSPWRYTGSDIHGFPVIPIVYWRNPMCTPWLGVQPLIEQIELAYSRLAENNKAYALRILFTKGADMYMESTIDGTPYQINTDETDADARFLEPADMSGSLKAEIDALEEAIYRGSFTVKTPDVRGSDLSGLAVELLFTDSTQKGHCDAQELKAFVGGMVKIVQHGLSQEYSERNLAALKVFSEIVPFVPRSDSEQVSNTSMLVAAGALSRQSASEISGTLGYGKTAEWRRIQDEEFTAMTGAQRNTGSTTLQLDQNVQQRTV